MRMAVRDYLEKINLPSISIIAAVASLSTVYTNKIVSVIFKF
jgi:hypothetical protein